MLARGLTEPLDTAALDELAERAHDVARARADGDDARRIGTSGWLVLVHGDLHAALLAREPAPGGPALGPTATAS